MFFFGDSICFGQGVSVHNGWVTRTSAGLSALSEQMEREIVVVNASINGNTSRLALERMPYDIQSQNADVLIVQFGMNDCNHWESDRGLPRVHPKAFAANLEEIVCRAFNFGVRKLIVHTNHPTARDEQKMQHSPLTYEQSNQNYNAIIRQVASIVGPRVTLVDIETIFKSHVGGDRTRLLSLLLPDQLHLSRLGHDLYFQSIYPHVESAVMALLRTDS